MGAWIREARGVSWPDPERKGVRHWRSRSVTVGAGWYSIGWLLWFGVVWPFVLAPLWLVAEFWLLTGSMAWVLAQWALHPETRWLCVGVRVLRWFWIVDLPSEGWR